jgi:hypothetical protein
MLGALMIGAIVTGFLLSASMKVAWLVPKMVRDFGYFTVLPLEIAIVFLFTRPALKLVSETQVSYPQVIERMAIFLGVITVVAQLVFVLRIEHAAPDLLFQQKTVIGFLVGETVESMIGALFYVPLFIGFSLLVDHAARESAGVVLVAERVRGFVV